MYASLPVAAESGHDANALGHHTDGSSPSIWEGSPQGVAYSEFNHHLAGAFLLLIGLSEFRQIWGLPPLLWTRLLLPIGLLGAGVFLLIWSDHEAWPIGSLTFMETYLGHDPEIVQHKAFGVLSLGVGATELLRRLGRIEGRRWTVPLPLFAVLGGLMLFGHMHGAHPSAHKIQIHHTAMGLLAMTAGSSKFVSGWLGKTWSKNLPRNEPTPPVPRWDVAWSVLILAMAIQLLMYSE
jgi:putative copper resistance protein D